MSFLRWLGGRWRWVGVDRRGLRGWLYLDALVELGVDSKGRVRLIRKTKRK